MRVSGLELSRLLERAEACANASFVEARRRLSPAIGAAWIEVGGAYAMFDGPDSPCTQTFGLGLFSQATAAHLDQIEAFFRERGAPVNHEVSPLADSSLLALLHDRGYAPIELTTVLFQELAARAPGMMPAGVDVRVVSESERELWARTNAEGWSDVPEAAAFVQDLAPLIATRDGEIIFLTEKDGHAIAAGALSVQAGVALLAGASTIPEFRGLGAQRALLEARLRHAAAAGCELAMMGAAPGSASQRNAERQGFRIAYTRIKWRKG